MTGVSNLERGRRLYAEQAWATAFDSLTSADREQLLGPEDLELLARSAYMIGRDDDYVAGLERAHQTYLDRGEVPRAVRCAFWIGHSFVFRGEHARGTGWFARAQRQLEGFAVDCVERGYLLIPVWLEQMSYRKFEEGLATATEAAAIGDRFGDADLTWLARDEQARALLGLGRAKEGLRLVDEVLAAAAANDLSPIVTGIVYCNTIAFCHEAFLLRQAREWTEALTVWCDRQPEMVAHLGLCLVHRAEVMQARGTRDQALEEAERALERFTRGALNRLAGGHAFYCVGEVHRLRGEFSAAEDAYRQASLHGREPQPGLALMRLAQGRADSAAAALRRYVTETTVPLRRVGILPAFVETMLAIGSPDLARAACRELDEVTAHLGCEALDAMAAYSRGVTLLAEDQPHEALIELRRALSIWTELEAPYEMARVRSAIGLACRTVGDHDTAWLELEAARSAFTNLGAVTEVAHIASLLERHGDRTRATTHGLTGRELEVLRHIAGGKSNREIADALFISEHTVARHVQNIFAKLTVSSRAAATAFAFSHQLV